MKTQLLSKLVSLRLWGGLYLLCYGLLLEVAYSAARYELPFQWAYHLALLGFSASLSWKLSNLIKPVVKFVWPVMFIVGTGALALGFFYLPWVLPTFYGDVRFGWPEHVVRALQGAHKLVLIIGGVYLLTSYLRSVLQRIKPKDDQPATAGVPPKGE
jgi:hypothetical protein